MPSKPAYFERVHDAARRTWETLEASPELSGAWWQLFRQVQSPRHVVSELLQNADDAGATWARATIEDGSFLFEHDGADFREEEFLSLCRFGFSNKRELHTIGFRGVGFKSTFSLGAPVELRSPTLSVVFHDDRFTLPHWADGERPAQHLTAIRVPLSEERTESELRKNLEKWQENPTSLLFLKNVRTLEVLGQSASWSSMGQGEAPQSEWMALNGNSDDCVLVIRSGMESFPADAVAEIRAERMGGPQAGEDSVCPPCGVQLVLNAPGRVYVFLPTDVELDLPFACNAPFIQDPGRMKIKDPGISPTNRWLLRRIGELAADAMEAWLRRTDLGSRDRASAYDLMPDVDRGDTSLEGACASEVELAFADRLGETSVLTAVDELVTQGQAVVVPDPLHRVWAPSELGPIFDGEGRPAVHPEVGDRNVQKLVSWRHVSRVTKDDVLRSLRDRPPPRPEGWSRLTALWSYVRPGVNRHTPWSGDLHVAPARAQDSLCRARDVVRLGEGRLLANEADWEFLAAHLLVLDQNWPRFLVEKRGAGGESTEADDALELLDLLGLAAASDAGRVVSGVATRFFSAGEVRIADCVHLAQIAARFDVKVDDAFRYVVANGTLGSPSSGLIFDATGSMADLYPADWYESHALNADYIGGFRACTVEEWQRWARNGTKSGLRMTPLPVETSLDLRGRARFEQEARARGYRGDFSYPYKPEHYCLTDWDFPADHWAHWERRAEVDPLVWTRLLLCILHDWPVLSGATKGEARQVATTGSTRHVADLEASWVRRLRGLPCVPDTEGRACLPSELLRLTAETEALLGVESFVDRAIDTEANHRLLELLGVLGTPRGPDALLSRLRVLATSPEPLAEEVRKWVWRLDQLMSGLPPATLGEVRRAFAGVPLILTEAGDWARAGEVYLSSDEAAIPDLPTVHPLLRELRLWRLVGVPERPTPEQAIEWLGDLESRAALSPADTSRVRAMARYLGSRIWDECGHWLSLSGHWMPVGELRYSLSKQSLIPWKGLYERVKRRTADLQVLSAETTSGEPFSALPSLGGCLEQRLDPHCVGSGGAVKEEWLEILGACVGRIRVEDEGDRRALQELGSRITNTKWHVVRDLVTVPYLDGEPAGAATRCGAAWLDVSLYVKDGTSAQVAKEVAAELGRAFERGDIRDAIKLCFARDSKFVRDYFAENFDLEPESAAEPEAPAVTPPPADDTAMSVPSPEVDASFAGRTPAGGPEEPEGAIEAATGGGADAEEARDSGEEDAEPGASSEAEDIVLRRRPQRSPGLIDRFAASAGFRQLEESRFVHNDGRLLLRTLDGPFPWHMLDAQGEVLYWYLPRDVCPMEHPVELETQHWWLLKEQPSKRVLLVRDREGRPLPFTGESLVAMEERGRVRLHPASYRIEWVD